MCRAQAWGVVCDATSRPRQQLYGREGGGSVGFGLLQLGRDQASEPPSPAPYQPFGLLQLLSCLCRQASISVTVLQRGESGGLSKPFHQTLRVSSLERINPNPGALENQLQLSGYVTFHSISSRTIKHLAIIVDVFPVQCFSQRSQF